jgi:two-component system chemotaxis response regulator CheY
MAVRAVIVDDSPLARAIIRHHLTKCGFVVVGEAENPLQAVKLCSELRPDLVTFDVMMPSVKGVDSLTAFQSIKSEQPAVILVVVSSLPFEKTREQFLQAGALTYLIKPFNQFSFEPARQKLLRIFPQMSKTAA